MSDDAKIYACLHAHSTHSDGVHSPEELAQVGAEEGYKALVLTDHDTISGNGEMLKACQRLGLECMPGIEFSTNFAPAQYGLHVTAFHFDPEYAPLKEYLRLLSLKETEQTRILFERGVQIGYIKGITWDEVLSFNEGITWLCNEHVFRAMKDKKLATDLDYREFFDTCYGKYRAEVQTDIQFMDVDQLIDLVHRAGGIAIAAHPVAPYGSLESISALVEYGIDGLEVWHGLLTGKERRQALELAREFDLYVSGGADHEGLLGGQYRRFENPKESKYYFPPLSLGTTQYFYEEIRDKQKKADRREVMTRLLEEDTLWITNGGILDQPSMV